MVPGMPLLLCAWRQRVFLCLSFQSAPALPPLVRLPHSSFSFALNLMFRWLADPEPKLWRGIGAQSQPLGVYMSVWRSRGSRPPLVGAPSPPPFLVSSWEGTQEDLAVLNHL